MSRYSDNPAEDGNAAGRADARQDREEGNPHVYGKGTRLSSAYTHGRDGHPCPKWAAEPTSKARKAWQAGKRDRDKALAQEIRQEIAQRDRNREQTVTWLTPAEEGNLAGKADAMADAFAAEMVALGFELCDDGFLRGPELPAHHLGKAYMVRTCYELVDGRWEGFASMRYAD